MEQQRPVLYKHKKGAMELKAGIYKHVKGDYLKDALEALRRAARAKMERERKG